MPLSSTPHGGNQNQNTAALDSVAAVGRVSAAPTPFSGPLTALKLDSTTASNIDPASGPPRLLPTSASAQSLQRRPESYNNQYDDGGQAGVQIAGGNGDVGMYSIHSAYQTGQIYLNPWDPTDPNNQFDILYAPTAHGSDGNCLENGSDYWTYESQTTTTAAFRVYSFCGNGFVLAKTMNSTFFSAYVRVVGNGHTPTYTTEMKKFTDGKWHALLYNYNTSSYEDLYSESGTATYNGGQGWVTFETHYTRGNCSTPPEIDAAGIRVQSPNGTWNYLTTGPWNQYGPYGNCIQTSSPATTITFPAPPQITDPQYNDWWATSA